MINGGRLGARLQQLLDATDIPNVVLKGVALEQLAYGSLNKKQTRDIDLLVPPGICRRGVANSRT